MREFRKRVFEIIEAARVNDKASFIYDVALMITIAISLLPLAFKHPPRFFETTDYITTVILVIDYFLRWMTADFKLKEGTPRSFVRYPVTPWAVVDLISILPTVIMLNNSLRIFRLFRMARTFRVFRVIKAFRYSKSLKIISVVIKDSANALIAVGTLAAGYILISAMIIFNVEQESFDNFFEAVYWATVSLTTVGYGDIYPVTTVGRIVAMISSLCGVAIVALPAGIITAGYMSVLQESMEMMSIITEAAKYAAEEAAKKTAGEVTKTATKEAAKLAAEEATKAATGEAAKLAAEEAAKAAAEEARRLMRGPF